MVNPALKLQNGYLKRRGETGRKNEDKIKNINPFWGGEMERDMWDIRFNLAHCTHILHCALF